MKGKTYICGGNHNNVFVDNGITIIVGAGAVLDFDHKGIFPSVPTSSYSAKSCRKKKTISGCLNLE